MRHKWKKLTTGVRYRKHPTRKRGARLDRYFSIYYKFDGKQHEEGLGWESEGWTEERVRNLNNELKHNRKMGKVPRTYQETMAVDRAKAAAHDTGKSRDRKETPTVSALFDSFQNTGDSHKNPKTIKRERHIFRDHIKPIIGDLPVKAVTTLEIEEIKRTVAEKGLAPSSISIVLSVVRQILEHGIRNNHFVGINPVSAVKTPRTNNKRMRFLTEEEAEKLLATLKPRSLPIYRITLFSLQLGLRAQEIFALTWSDIDIEKGVILIRSSSPEHNRFAYITPRVKAELEVMPDGGPGTLLFPPREGKHEQRQLISKTFSRTVQDLGFNDNVTDPRRRVVFHTCRHSFANWLIKRGVDIRVVKELLGHRSLSTTERYSNVTPDVLRETMKTLEIFS